MLCLQQLQTQRRADTELLESAQTAVTVSIPVVSAAESMPESVGQTVPCNTLQPQNQNQHQQKDISMNTTTLLTIEGMSCGHCSARVEKVLNALEGVSATVDLAAKTASVTHPDTVSVDALKNAVIDAGYSVSASSSDR